MATKSKHKIHKVNCRNGGKWAIMQVCTVAGLLLLKWNLFNSFRFTMCVCVCVWSSLNFLARYGRNQRMLSPESTNWNLDAHTQKTGIRIFHSKITFTKKKNRINGRECMNLDVAHFFLLRRFSFGVFNVRKRPAHVSKNRNAKPDAS